MKYSDHGIPIVDLSTKLEYLRYCMTEESFPEVPREDAMGHLFDLIHHIAPGWKFCGMDGIGEIAAHYGKHPTPIEE